MEYKKGMKGGKEIEHPNLEKPPVKVQKQTGKGGSAGPIDTPVNKIPTTLSGTKKQTDY